MFDLAKLSGRTNRCITTARAIGAAAAQTWLNALDVIRARATEFEDGQRARAKIREANEHAPERSAPDNQPLWAARPVRIIRDDFAIEWRVPTEPYTVVDVRLERFPKSLSMDIIVEGTEVLQRVFPVPEKTTAEFYPEVSIQPGEVLLRWLLPHAATAGAAPLAAARSIPSAQAEDVG